MTTETTSLENVAWTAQNVTLFMRGQAMALNLQNATANFGDNHFTGGRELFAKASEAQVGGTAAINAAAGTANTISYISESISIVGVSVDVPTNASLTFSNCGRVGTTNQLVFGADGNKFDVDAGTLLLDDSTLRITQSATDSFFNVRNNGHLKLQGTGTKLNLNGGTLSIDSSQLTIDRNTSLETSGFIRLADATASMILGGRLTAQLLEADGTALITAQEEVAPHPTGGGAHVAGIQFEDNATTLTIRGTSTERAGLYFDGASSLYLQGGTLALEKAPCVVDTELFLSIMKPPLLAEP